MSWKDALKVDPSEWLLETSNPSVRFWALQNLEDKTLGDPEVQETQDTVMRSAPVRAILDAQEPEGHWIHREGMYLPKYRSTTSCLLILAELGARRTPASQLCRRRRRARQAS